MSQPRPCTLIRQLMLSEQTIGPDVVAFVYRGSSETERKCIRASSIIPKDLLKKTHPKTKPLSSYYWYNTTTSAVFRIKFFSKVFRNIEDATFPFCISRRASETNATTSQPSSVRKHPTGGSRYATWLNYPYPRPPPADCRQTFTHQGKEKDQTRKTKPQTLSQPS